MDRIEMGRRGEDAAAAYLSRLGMEIVDRNWRSDRGEIDIVAVDGDVLVFCEVKTRKSTSAGTAEDAVSPSKQKRLVHLAAEYIARAGSAPCATRFDVVAIHVLAEDRALLRHHRAAFCAE